MKKILTVSIVLVVVMSISSFATNTRVLTMGQNNLVLEDDANIWIFPGRVYNYPSLAIGEFSRFAANEFTNFGIHWKFGEENPWVLATYFSTLPEGLPHGFDAGTFGNWDVLDGSDHKRIDLLWGRELGVNKFGVHFGYNKTAYQRDDANKLNEEFHVYELGLGLTEAGGKWDLGFSVSVGGWTDEDSAGNIETEADGYMDVDLIGRMFWTYNPNMTFIPHVGFGYGKHGEKDNMAGDADPTTNDINTKVTYSVLDAGMGLNWVPSSNVLAVADFGFAYQKSKAEFDWDTTYLDPAGTADDEQTILWFPYWQIGFEADVFSWMDIRMGATSEWRTQKNEPTPLITSKWNYAWNQTYLGFGFHWGRLYVDTYTDPQMFLDGFNFVSGSNNKMNFQISALYEMF